MQKIDETIANYIIDNHRDERLREDVYQKYGIILQDLDLDFSDDGLLVNKYPNIFTIKYQSQYTSSPPKSESYVLFDMSSGLCYNDQLVKYNFQCLNGIETTRGIRLYEPIVMGKHFDPKTVKAHAQQQQQQSAQQQQSPQQGGEYFVVLQYSPSVFRISQFPQKLSFILSPKLDKKLLRTNIQTINSLEQEHSEHYQYKSYTDSLQDVRFNTPLNNIIKQQILDNQKDYLMQRQWYNIAKFMEKIESDRKENNNTIESKTSVFTNALDEESEK